MSFSLLLAIFLVITPIFGKSIDYQESIILYAAIILFFIFSRFRRSPPLVLHKKFILYEIVLIALYIISTIFSKNIGFSYYGFFRYLFTLTLLNLCLTNLKSEKLSQFIYYSSLIYGLIFFLNKIGIIHLLPRPFYDNFILQIWGHSYMADIIIMAIPIAIYQLLYQKPTTTKNKLFYSFSLLFLLITLIFTNSRSATISLTVGSIYLLLPKIKSIFKPLIFIIIIFALAYFTNQILYLQESTLKSPGGNRIEYWKQAIYGFIESPVIGNGPNNFFYLNKKYQSQANSNTNYAHNYFLELLALNGLPFTLIFFTFILFGLKYQLHRNPLNFSIALTALLNTLLDPAWNSLGIFCLSLFYIFNQSPFVVTSQSKSSSQKLSATFSCSLFILICLYYITKTAADILYINNQKLISLRFDPFNLDNSLSLDPKFLNKTIFLYSHDIFLYRELVRTTYLPQNEKYYYQLFSLSPKENLTQYTQLAAYYLDQNLSEKLSALLSLINHNINPNSYTRQETFPIAKIYYETALKQWRLHQFETAINNFRAAVRFSNGWGDIQMELANAYWAISQKDQAINQLQVECQKIPSSANACQKYLAENQNKFPPPGNKQTTINLVDPGYFPLSDNSIKQISDYRQFIIDNPLPKSEDYYYQIFNINPRENLDLYYELANYYFTQKQDEKLNQLLLLINNNVNTNVTAQQQTIPLAKIYYQVGLNKWHNQQFNEAIIFFKMALRFSKDWADFYIELANAYWTIGQKDLAINELQVECQKIPASANACQKYFLEHKDKLLEPGAFETSINSISVIDLHLSNTILEQISDYRKLIKNNPLPQGEEYYYKIFSLNPGENFDLYYELANYYLIQKQFNKLEKLLTLASQNINTDRTPVEKILPLAKIFYHFGLIKWEEKQYDQAINYFQKAVLFSQSWTYFHIELANAYWALDQKDLALKQLNVNCQVWPVSFYFCQDYLKKYQNNLLPLGTPQMIQRIDTMIPYQNPGQI